MSIPLTLAAALPGEAEEGAHAALFRHLAPLFALAQVIVMSTEGAVRLVEATYRRAFLLLEEQPPPDDLRLWLSRLMLQIHGARLQDAEAPPADAEASPPAPPANRSFDDLRRRLTEQLLDEALPAAFATLASQHRLLLMLCEVEDFTCADAGAVLGLPPETACAELERARTALYDALHANVTEVERHLLDTSLPEEWRRRALGHLAESSFAPLPPTLRPTLQAAAEAAGSPATDDDDLPPPAPADEAAPPTHPWWQHLKGVAATLLLILVAGLLGYGFSALLRQEPETNLLTLSARQAEDAELTFRTASAEQAERYVRDRMGRRLVLPGIDQATLLGTGIQEVAPGVEAPVFFYEDAATGQPVTLYAYSYAFLDRYQEQVQLDRDLLRQIEDDGNFDIYDFEEAKVLVWRYRDEIYVAVTPGDPDSLRERIFFPS